MQTFLTILAIIVAVAVGDAIANDGRITQVVLHMAGNLLP